MKVEIYDTTLRDGAQTQGISFSVADKLQIVEKLDELGITYIEGGWPGANPKDVEFFKKAKKLKLKNAKLAAFGSTRRANTDVSKDAVINGLLRSDVNVITIFGKSWALHVKEILKTTLEENLQMIEDSVRYLKSKGKFVIFDAEHFFDGYKDNSEYAIKTLLSAEKGGADRIVLCDTNGGMLTSTVFKVVEEVKKEISSPLGIHAHNDSDMAVANSLAAVEAGCVHVQGTINGYGERCGNANIISIIANLKLKLGADCISDLQLKELTEIARYVAEVSNMNLNDNLPFVGASAFAHKAGVHVNAILKNPDSYEHTDPGKVGNRRKLLISELSGQSSILKKSQEIELGLSKEAPQTKKILNALQKLEHKGYHFEVAEASLDLFMKKAMKKFKSFFELKNFRVTVRKKSKSKLTSAASIELIVKGKSKRSSSFGDGPVNALDNALRKALKDFYPGLAEMRLTDFKVRVLEEKVGTEAKVRVLIESQDSTDSWWTIGVSENIIEASWQALVDSVEYKLLKEAEKI
ncbi:MAG: citramalate synthase [Candidatus Omnitrophota bacterium]